MRHVTAVCLALAGLGSFGCSSSTPERSSRAVAAAPTRTVAAPGAYAPPRGADGSGLAATSSMPVDLPTVMRLASGQNLDVQLVRERLREAHAEQVGAGWWPLPTIRPAVRFNRVDGNVQGTQGQIFDVGKNNAFVGGGVAFDWELGDAIFEQLSAQQRARASRHAVNAGVNDATLAAAEAYFDLLRAQTALGIADESMQLYETLVKETQAQTDAGQGFRGDVLRARAKLSHAKVVQRRADGEQRVAAARLREVLNLPSTVELFASESQPAKLAMVDADMPAEDLVRTALAGRPELQEARALARAAKADRDKTTLGPYIPRVRAGWEGGGFGHNFGSLGGTSDVGVGLEWKVGRGGIGDKPRAAAAAARERQSRLRIQQTQQRVVREVTSAQAEAQARSGAIAAAEAGVKDAQEALQLFRQRQEIGVGIPLDAIVAEETFTEARMDYLDAVVGFNKAQMRLLRAVGRAR